MNTLCRLARALRFSLLVAILISGCTKSSLPRVDPLPFPAIADYNASTLGQLTTLLKTLPGPMRGPEVGRFLRDHPAWPLIEHDTLVSFLWFGRARVVAIAGDLQNGWAMPDTMEPIPCGRDTLFTRVYTLPKDVRLDYLFVVDGGEMRDPRNPRITPSGFGPHSEVAMPGFVSSRVRLPRPGTPHGTFDSVMFMSSNNSLKPRRLTVYRPAGYEHLSALPVLYVYDGIEAIEDMAYATVLDNLIEERAIESVLVVFIPFAEGDMPYLFEKHRESPDALCDEMVRFIDQRYRTKARPERRAIAGFSAGGEFALMTLLKRPDVFLCAAGQSPSIKGDLFDALDMAVKKGNDRPPFRIYFDVGRYDLNAGGMEGLTFLQAAREFHDEMEKYGLVHVYHETHGGHQWADWREKTEEILVYFFGLKRE